MTELFEKYYAKTLSEDERIDFENRIKSDEEFAADYEAYVMMMVHLDTKDEINTALNVLDDVHGEQNDNSASGSNFVKVLIGVILLSIFAYGIYRLASTPEKKEESPRAIFASYFEPAPVSLATKGGDIERVLAQINLDYSVNKHIKVINALNQMNLDSIGDNKLFLMLGSSFINNGFYKESREALKPLESSSQFKNEYYWYTAMSFLGEGNLDAAKDVLMNIPQDSNYYSRAQSILEE